MSPRRSRTWTSPHRSLVVRAGKGGKDRLVMLPQSLMPALREQLARGHALWAADCVEGKAGVEMPDALERKYPRAGASWPWFWVFPQATHSTDPRSGVIRRHHMFDQTFQRAFKSAVHSARITKSATPHTLRHALPHTCCRPATTSGRCRSCWATET